MQVVFLTHRVYLLLQCYLDHMLIHKLFQFLMQQALNVLNILLLLKVVTKNINFLSKIYIFIIQKLALKINN